MVVVGEAVGFKAVVELNPVAGDQTKLLPAVTPLGVKVPLSPSQIAISGPAEKEAASITSIMYVTVPLHPFVLVYVNVYS